MLLKITPSLFQIPEEIAQRITKPSGYPRKSERHETYPLGLRPLVHLYTISAGTINTRRTNTMSTYMRNMTKRTKHLIIIPPHPLKEVSLHNATQTPNCNKTYLANQRTGYTRHPCHHRERNT